MLEADAQTSFICPVVVGRSAPRERLQALIELACGGVTLVTLVSGEAGIGKSRLLADAKEYALERGFVPLLDGQCFQSESMFPYAPLLDFFRAYFAGIARAGSSARADLMRSFAATLSRLMPELALHFPELATQTIAESADPYTEQRRLFAALTHFVRTETTQHPVLLVVEDLHWCDDLSLDVLLHLVRHVRQAPLLLLATYRTEEAHPRLLHWLAELERDHVSREIALEPLKTPEIETMVQATLSATGAIDPTITTMVAQRSEGNPFFVEELLKSLTSAGAIVRQKGIWRSVARHTSVPRGVRDAVRQRIAMVSPDARYLANLAAAFGRRFNINALRLIVQGDQPQLLGLLKELLAAQLINEESDDQFAFRHALTQEAIYTEMLVSERRGLHRLIATSLIAQATSLPFQEKYLSQIAYHCFEGELWDEAATYARQAGERAVALYAQQAAIENYSHALQAEDHRTGGDPDRVSTASMHLARGKAYETLGEFEHARDDYERALALAVVAPDHQIEWQCLNALGFLWTGHDYARAETWFRQSLALAERLDDQELRALSLFHLGNWFMNVMRLAEAMSAIESAQGFFQQNQDRRGIAMCLEMLGACHYFAGNAARGVNEYFHSAIVIWRELGDKSSLSSTLAARALDAAPETLEVSMSSLRSPDAVLCDADEALQLAQQTNNLVGQAFAKMAATQAHASFGDLGTALAHGEDALQIARSIEHQEWIAAAHGALGQVYLLLLDKTVASEHLEAGLIAAHQAGSTIWVATLTPYLALARILQRDFAAARDLLETILQCDQSPRLFLEAQALRVWGEWYLARGDAKSALSIVDTLLTTIPGADCQHIPHLLALKGESLIALKRWDAALECLHAADEGASQRQAPSIRWRIQHLLARAYHHTRQEDAERRAWLRAREIIASLAATISDVGLRERFRAAAFATLQPRRGRATPLAADASLRGLSAREREVVSLIAQGLSNREIAMRLVISDRTAEVHVSNILGKLGFATRAQIAAWVIKQHHGDIRLLDQ